MIIDVKVYEIAEDCEADCKGKECKDFLECFGNCLRQEGFHEEDVEHWVNKIKAMMIEDGECKEETGDEEDT